MANTAAQELIQRHPLQRLESPSRGASALLHVNNIPYQMCRLHSILMTIEDHRPSLICLLLLLPRAQPESDVSNPIRLHPPKVMYN